MKATLKITAVNKLMIAAAAVRSGQIYFESDCPDFVNLCQHMKVTGDIVAIDGHRCALWADGYSSAMAILKELEIAGHADLVSYETSDSRLHWHETLEGYMWERSNLDEWFVWAKKHFSYQTMLIPRRFDDAVCAEHYMWRTGGNERGLNAGYSREVARIAKLVYEHNLVIHGPCKPLVKIG